MFFVFLFAVAAAAAEPEQSSGRGVQPHNSTIQTDFLAQVIFSISGSRKGLSVVVTMLILCPHLSVMFNAFCSRRVQDFSSQEWLLASALSTAGFASVAGFAASPRAGQNANYERV